MRESDVDTSDGDQAGFLVLLVLFDAFPVIDNTLHRLDQRHKFGEILTELLSFEDLEEVVQFGLLWEAATES
jgi:hypothetical protein